MANRIKKLEEVAQGLKDAAEKQAGELFGNLNKFYTVYLEEAQRFVDYVSLLEKENADLKEEIKDQVNVIISQKEQIQRGN